MTSTSLDALLTRFRSGERGALARLLSLVENDRAGAEEAVSRLYHATGRAGVIGVTGPPGAGKSTLTRTLVEAYRRREKSVAVLAFDPSSAISGGAALGDRIRMLDLWNDDGVFVRSMATRGHYGGLSLAANSAVHLLDAYGFDVILIETVGVGQGEVDVARVARTTLLLQVPGLGDMVQTIKAGILEVADILVVNKADLPDADAVVENLRGMIHLETDDDAWLPSIVKTEATSGHGIDELLDAIERHRDFLSTTVRGQQIAGDHARDEIMSIVRRELEHNIHNIVQGSEFERRIQAVVERRVTPLDAAREVRAALHCIRGGGER